MRISILAMAAMAPLLAMTSAPFVAEQKARAEPPPHDAPCFDPTKLRSICVAVANHRLDGGSDGDYEYRFERMMDEAACVDRGRDSDAVRQAKIQAAWTVHPELFRCTASDFDVNPGSLLKYAIASRTFALLTIAVTEWKIDLNQIDPADNKTVLDYLDDRLGENRGTEFGSTLTQYRDMLRANGAKRRSELP